MVDLGQYAAWSSKCAEVAAASETVRKAIATVRAGAANMSPSHAHSYTFFTSIIAIGSAYELLLEPATILMLTQNLQATKHEEVKHVSVCLDH